MKGQTGKKGKQKQVLDETFEEARGGNERMKLMRFDLLRLESLFRSMAFAFPPPNMTDIGHISDEALKLDEDVGGSTIELVIEVVSYLQKTLPKDAINRLQAIREVLLSNLFVDKYPWDKTLMIVKDQWPTWGAPWLLAAKSFLKDGCSDRSLECISSAEKRLFVSYMHLMKLLDELRKVSIPQSSWRGKNDINLATLSILARHRPLLRNLALLADRARMVKEPDLLQDVVKLCLRIHGRDPNEWPISEDYAEMSSAGAMCMHVNKVAVDSRSPEHDFIFWNQAAIAFFKKSLAVNRPDNPDKSILDTYAIVRLCETYANMLTYNPQLLLEEEIKHDLDQVEFYAVMIAKAQRSQVYGTMRRLTRIYQAKARFLRMKEAPAAEIEETLQKAKRLFREMMTYVYPNSPAKRRIVRDFTMFLFDFGEIDEGLAINEQHYEDIENRQALISISAKYKAGSRKQAIKELTRLLREERDAKRILGYVNILFFYIQKTISDGATINKSVIASAKKETRDKLGILIDSCKFFLDKNILDQARNYFNILEWADDDELSANVVHIGARVNLLKIKEGQLTAEEAVSWVFDKLKKKPSLKNDAYISSILLSTYARGASAQLDSQTFRTLVSSTDSDTHDVVNSYELLKLSVLSDNLDGWLRIFCSVVKEYPADSLVLDLPRFLYGNNPEKGSSIITKILLKACDEIDLQPCMMKVCQRLPGDFFSSEGVIPTLFGKLNKPWTNKNVWRQYLGGIITGLCKGQIDSWSDPDLRRQQSLNAAKWIDGRLSQVGVWKWTQWLGANRGHFSDTLVAGLSEDIEALQRTLVSSELTCGIWIDHIHSFLDRYRATGSQSIDPSLDSTKWKEIKKYCIIAVKRFRPDRQDPTYWFDMSRFVDGWCSEIETERTADILANAWIDLHKTLETVICKPIIEVVWGEIHDFKNSLDRNHSLLQKIHPVWIDTFNNVVGKTLQLLRFHRYPAFGRVDLRAVLEETAFDRPFVPTRRRDKVWAIQPRLYVVRPEQPVEVTADRELLVAAIKSLLVNAANHTDPKKLGGWIWAEVFQEDHHGGIRIINSGREDDDWAVSPNIIQSLNDPNAKPFSSTKSTGYGSRLCHRIAALHDGDLRFSVGHANLGLRAELIIPRFIQGDVEDDQE